jgi:RNA polymerase sigma-70 factor, ECF subfamily
MERLGERLARGEQAAFTELYDDCADRLHHFLVLRLGSREDADDVLQNTFVRLVYARRRLAGIESLFAYVFKVAQNEASRFLGRRGRESGFSQVAGLLFHEAATGNQAAREAAELVAAAMARLTPEQREIVELKIYVRLTFREIAEVVGVPQGTAATRYRTAIERMKEWWLRELP